MTAASRARSVAPFVVVALLIGTLAACSAGTPPEPTPREFPLTLNDVYDNSRTTADEIIAEFAGSQTVVPADGSVDRCFGEDPGVGRWTWATAFTAPDLAGTIAHVQQEYGDAVTSTGAAAQPIEYADGTEYAVGTPHTLIEVENGSYLLTYPLGAEGVVTMRVVTACGQLR